MPLTITELFTPVESGVRLDPNLPVPDDTWLSTLIASCQALGLPTTSWQPGAPERTILAMCAVSFAQEDVQISLQAQGGFFDFAANGTVTAFALDGTPVVQPVTPDPSIPSQNPNGTPGWLDALGQSFYDSTRLPASYARGSLAIANTTVGTLNYGASTYHVANASTGATYSNVDDITVPPSVIGGTGGVITAVAVGSPLTTITTQSAHGLSPNQVVYISGANGVSNLNGYFALVTAVTATTLTIARATSGVWTSGGTVYLATVVTMAADVIGIDSNASAGAVTTTVTTNPGVYVNNLVPWSAANWESNAAYAARTKLKLASASPNGPSQAYEYFALTAQAILADQVPAVVLTNGPIAKAIAYSNPQTGVERVVVASTTPASTTLGDPVTPGCAKMPITDATNATPIVIQTATDHGLVDGDAAIVTGVLGNTAANGHWIVTFVDVTHISLNSSVGNAVYTGGGSLDGGDLGQVDAVIEDNVVPDGITETTESALAFPVAVVATVVVPQAYVATYQAAAPVALQALLASFPIGGNIPPGGSNGTVPWSAVEGALIAAGVLTIGQASYVRQVSALTINGVTTDLNYPAPNYVAQLPSPTITVVGI